jgi:signal peptidase I
MLDDKDYHEQETDVYSLDYEYEPSLGEAESDVQDAVARPPRSQSSAKMEFYDWIQCVVSAVIFGILVFVFIGRVMGVDGMSMLPTLHHNDKFIMSNLFYTPKYGDIVVIKTDTFGDTPIVKRVIATEGQTVDIDFNAGVVYVDGEPLDEPYTNAPTFAREDFYGPLTVPEGHVFVMGDNRNASTDSRSNAVGLVDTRRILGRVMFILLPAEQWNRKEFWARIGPVR